MKPNCGAANCGRFATSTRFCRRLSPIKIPTWNGYTLICATCRPNCRAGGPAYEFDDEVRLEYYRLQKISEGSISLNEGGPAPRRAEGSWQRRVARQPVPLSRLIDVINDRFGTDFNQADQLFFDQLVEGAAEDRGFSKPPRRTRKINSRSCSPPLESLFIERMEQNEEIFARYMNDPAFQRAVAARLATEAYKRLAVEKPVPKT